jgi:hypothetical protein
MCAIPLLDRERPLCTTLRLHRFGANRPCRPTPACAVSSGYAPRACRCSRSTACNPALSPDAPVNCAPVLEGDATHHDAIATRISTPSSQRTMGSACVVVIAHSVIADPQHRLLVSAVLAGAQYLLRDPSRHALHDCPQIRLVGGNKHPCQHPLKWAAGVDGAQGFDGADKGLAPSDDAVGRGGNSHLVVPTKVLN